GKIVLVFDADGREAETDMCAASQFVTPEIIKKLRRDAGGLVCCTVKHSDAKRLGLPFMVDVLNEASAKYPLITSLSPHDIPYDSKSSFSLTVNHRETRTGITDFDRALTIGEMGRLLSLEGDLLSKMGALFRSPGHVHLLIAAKGLLENRQGHTELCTALALMAGLTPSVTICEMMGDNGKALPKEQAQEYARARGMVYLDGRLISEAFEQWSK
ncbi:MAG TPA: 3,4-dihydroxy-2-butanone-4-phosphate synthase, partial [Euryarchaeota archaeon]|nr:3,4-dihydroxy-2-butanone-4-phosphate synthase [Euryarchaeota archaeon]